MLDSKRRVDLRPLVSVDIMKGGDIDVCKSLYESEVSSSLDVLASNSRSLLSVFEATN